MYKCVLSLSHGNSAPENGFSINKRIIDIHGNSIEKETKIKDRIINCENILDIPIKKEMIMIDFVKLSRERYHTDLEAKRKLKEDEEKAMKQIQSEKDETTINAAKQREDESNKLCNAILQVETGLTVAGESVDEGNKQLKELLTKKMPLGKT